MEKKTTLGIFAGIILGAGISLAAVGDVTYDISKTMPLTTGQLTSIGTWAVNNGLWDGNAADLDSICVQVRRDTTTRTITGGFARSRGKKVRSAADFANEASADGVRVMSIAVE